ncbi:TetR/AcrR family transcriptional regulator [Nocardia yamanashiensis]|uniref:TetR/AcrR family transcriptional regulator n=1 Tax=Nocardia yamanashiensis TaxID=209247 RepID=UPI001E37A51E|nr:TetR/AcrR family transcriptional regulator [Nocardia yamanashiensis]UGT41724.1 TetR/AcrR family transcriptional regulator [Nocardia yamanashiensis]
MTERPLRADARRNRERVLAAAQEAFAAEGVSVPLDEIARRAGVGPGTVYRHFPTKEALFEAAMLDRIERMAERARVAASSADPGVAFFEFLDRMVMEGAAKRDLAAALGPHDPATYAGPTAVMKDAIGELLSRAQAAGAVRGDIGIGDLMTLLQGHFMAMHAAGSDPGLRDRTFAVLADGLRHR